MSSISAISRCLLAWLTLVSLVSGCRSTPASVVSIPSESSLLAVDVLFPSPLGRDHSLVQAFFVRGPIDAGSSELPELVPASFVKRSRAYLLDPEPGTYSLVAVSSQVAPDWNNRPGVGGVSKTVLNEQLGHLAVFPAVLIEPTRTAVRPGEVAFMGALRVSRSDRIKADAVLQDELQQRVAEEIRPGATSRSGLAGRFSMTWMVDLEATSFSNEAADREAFFDAALTDLGDSPWAPFVARAAPPKIKAARAPKPVPRDTTAAGSRTPEPREKTAAKTPTPVPRDATAASSGMPELPETTTAKAPTPETRETATDKVPTPAPRDVTAAGSRTPEPREVTEAPAPEPDPNVTSTTPVIAATQPQVAIPDPELPMPESGESPPVPKRQIIAGIPPDSPLAQIEVGMHHSDVRKILGEPDERIDRRTAKGWIPFYEGPGARLIEWVYAGVGRVVFSQHTGLLLVFDAVHDPDEPK